MKAYRHILPRMPLLQPRDFGILDNRWAGIGVGVETGKARTATTAERHFRAPLPVAPAQQLATPGPVQFSVTNIRLSPRFEVLTRNHMVATKTLSVQTYSPHLASLTTPTFITGVATTRAIRRKSAMHPSPGKAQAAARRNANAQLIMQHFQPPGIPPSSSASPGKLNRPIAPWRVFSTPLVPDKIAGDRLSDKRINTPFAARIHGTDPSERRPARQSYLHRRLATSQQVTAIARRHLAVSHLTEALSSTRLRSVADRAQNSAYVRQRADPIGPSHKAPLKDRAPAAYTPLSTAVYAPARGLRGMARATETPALTAPTPRNFRASPPEPTIAAAPESKPASSTQPKAPQINIQQLDKVLWQRFEKRLRVEIERTGRG